MRLLTSDGEDSSEELAKGIEMHRAFCFDRSGAFIWMRSVAVREDVEKVYDGDSEHVKAFKEDVSDLGGRLRCSF